MGEYVFNGNEHNLENAGKTLGQMYNVNKFDSNYKRKKGMRVFLVMLILAVIVCSIPLLIKEYPPIQVIYASDTGIIVHEIKTDTFGKSRLAWEKTIPYDYDSFIYDQLVGKAAQIAYEIKNYKAEIIIADAKTLILLTPRSYLANVTIYIDEDQDQNLLTLSAEKSTAIMSINCGVKVEKSNYYPQISEDSYLGIVSGVISRMNEDMKAFMVIEFARKIIEGEPYQIGRRVQGSDLVE